MLIVDDERSFHRPENSGTTVYARNNKEAIHVLMTMDFSKFRLITIWDQIRKFVHWSNGLST